MKEEVSPHSLLKEIPFASVEIIDGFWSKWLDINSSSSIFHQWESLEEYKTIDNFRLISEEKEGFREGFFYSDSDSHKWAEAAATILATSKSDILEKLLKYYFELIKKTQTDDGYIFTFNQFHFPEKRWINFQIEHELYSLGHLIEASIASYKTTKNRNFLEIGIKAADLLVKEFSEITPKKTPGHPEIEIALLRLYRTVKKKEYLELATEFIEKRGRIAAFSLEMVKQYFSHSKRLKEVKKQKDEFLIETKVKGIKLLEDLEKEGPIGLIFRFYSSALTGKYLQQHKPIQKMKEPVGHCVRWDYLATAAVMLYQETGDDTIIETLKKAWDHMVSRRMFITGGLGSLPVLEGFGRDFELNTLYNYNETCAALGSIFWSWEMLLCTEDAKYADLIEWQLYNAALVGMSLDGKSYFYRNPLETRKNFIRKRWYKTACCPSNISRTLAKIGNYVYSQNSKGFWIHQYIGNNLEYIFDQYSKMDVNIKSNLPWEGNVVIKANSSSNKTKSIFLRIPSWVKRASVSINDELKVNIKDKKTKATTASGYSPFDSFYYEIKQIWKGENTVHLELQLDISIHQSHPRVRNNRNKIALSRGPLVYCFESIDNPFSNIPNATIDLDSPIKAEFSDILNGLWIIKTKDLSENCLTAIPYYSWGNRDPSKVQVWIRKG